MKSCVKGKEKKNYCPTAYELAETNTAGAGIHVASHTAACPRGSTLCPTAEWKLKGP